MPGQRLCVVSGPARSVLTGERTALNFLQMLSGTATAAYAFVAAVSGTSAVILDTRKTLPGLRLAQKYAVRTGGAHNHRIGLYDAILIKENHLAAGGGITRTLEAAREIGGDVLIEIEVETLDQVREALVAGAHRLLLDNFSRGGTRGRGRPARRTRPGRHARGLGRYHTGQHPRDCRDRRRLSSQSVR